MQVLSNLFRSLKEQQGSFGIWFSPSASSKVQDFSGFIFTSFAIPCSPWYTMSANEEARLGSARSLTPFWSKHHMSWLCEEQQVVGTSHSVARSDLFWFPSDRCSCSLLGISLNPPITPPLDTPTIYTFCHFNQSQKIPSLKLVPSSMFSLCMNFFQSKKFSLHRLECFRFIRFLHYQGIKY